jgi:amidase
MPDFPPSLAEARSDRAAIAMTALVRPFNVSGHPALTLPINVPAQGTAGLQLVGRRGADSLVFAVATRIDAALRKQSAGFSLYTGA